ncbi:HHIP-like protein 2 isoform X1 [Mya arenaria]|uniref:HHIP-like protein 2 isoform X1 n=1 Tax=Mya arenaria TaxID=6604 RepID=UPI0022E3BB62|nr:HHIP-like protein 2 isoform X1 [Mya arenaria]
MGRACRKLNVIWCSGLLFLVLIVVKIKCHPQCLDSRPPFKGTGLTFCSQYQDYGCCTSQDDVQLKERYDRIQQLIPPENQQIWTDCSEYAKTFVCQECSPYAAHIFDAEQTTKDIVVKPRAFPGLCKNYCSTFYQKCKDFVKYYMDEAGSGYMEEALRLTEALSSQMEFCTNGTKLIDNDYCFPELLTNPILNGNITIEKVTQEGCLCLEPMSTVFYRNPIFLKHANDSSKRMFVGEQIGLVHIMYPDGRVLEEPFLDLTYDIKTTSSKGDERGMLGMAFHPNYINNGLFYIYYSTHISDYEQIQSGADHKIRIEEFKVRDDNPNSVNTSYSRVILEVYEPYWNHNGGEILFGDDGYMYLFIGDGGMAGDPLNSGQDLNSLLGKVLRIDVDNVDYVRRTEYSIPPDNPFVNDIRALPEVYAYGVRNIWRCGKDRGDPITKFGKGRIVCGDVGQSAREEIDLIEKGANYGWKKMEGTAPYCSACKYASGGNVTAPIWDYPHSFGKSVTGGHFYRGCQSPNLQGYYIYGDFMSGRLFRLLHHANNDTWTNKELKMCASNVCVPPLVNDYATSIISFGEDEKGEVYMLSTDYASTTVRAGTVYKIVDPIRRGNPQDCKGYDVQTPPTITTPQVNTPQKTTATVSHAPSTIPPVAVPAPRISNYLDYYRQKAKHDLRNKRRKIQQEFEEERSWRRTNLVTFRENPPLRDTETQGQAGLVLHGVNVHRCTSRPSVWCSLNRLVPRTP